MSGNREGSLKAAATAIGVTLEELLARFERGEKWCSGCRAWHPTEAFGRDASRGDGLAALCRESRKKTRAPTARE